MLSQPGEHGSHRYFIGGREGRAGERGESRGEQGRGSGGEGRGREEKIGD